MAQKDLRQYNTPLSYRICDKLDLPDDVCKNSSHIEIISNCCAMVDGCKSVLEYNNDIIKLNLGKNKVAFLGTSLTIKSLDSCQAVIEGNIVAIEFSS